MNFTLANYFMCVFSIIFIIFYVSEVSTAPTASTYPLLKNFLQFLNKENCIMPSAIDLPFNIHPEEQNPWNFLLVPLQSCENVDNDNSKVPYALCTEIFDAVANISCRIDQNIQLPRIKLEISTNVCQDFNKMESIFSANTDYIGKKIAADNVICDVICSGKEMNACKFLLWTYEVQKQVSDYLENVNNTSFHHNSVTFNEIQDSNLDPEGLRKIPGQDINDLQDEANTETTKEQTEHAEQHADDDGVKIQTPDLANKNTQTKVPIQTVDKDIPLKEEEEQKDLNKTNDELLTKDHDKKVPDDKMAVKSVLNEEDKPSPASDNEISKTGQDINGEKNSSDFTPITPNNNSTKSDASTTKSSFHTTTKTQSPNSVDNQKQTLADNKDIDSKKKINEDLNSESNIPIGTKAKIDAKIDVHNKNELPEEKNSDNKTVTDNLNVSENLQPGIPNADEKENLIPDSPESTKANPNVDEFSNSLPEDDTGNLYDKNQSGSLIPDANKEPKLSNELSNSFDKAEDKSDILLDREQEPNIDMESDFGESDFPSQDNGRSPVERIQVIPMSQGIFPEQDDSHFFFYFLTIIFIVMAGYLIFHNKQKIIALIVEGRHERRRRSHGVGYKKLDTK